MQWNRAPKTSPTLNGRFTQLVAILLISRNITLTTNQISEQSYQPYGNLDTQVE